MRVIKQVMNNILKVATLLLAFVLPSFSSGAQAVSEKKIERDARKLAKTFVKDGWKTAPGFPSIELQQLRAGKINNTFDDQFNQKYVFGTAQAVGPNYDAAKYQATELAKIDIAGKISSEIAGIAETNIGNTQLEPGEAAAVVKTVGAYKSFVATKLVNIISVVDMYKVDPSTHNTTVQIGLFYNREEALKAGMKAIRDEMMKESQELGKELDQLLNL